MTDPLTYGQKETLFDLSFNLGYSWARLNAEARSRIMDAIGGSRSLVEMATLWADEFDTWFAAKTAADPDCCTYMEDVDDFFTLKWGKFVATHLAARIIE